APGVAWSVSFSPDGKSLAIGTEPRQVAILNLATPQEIAKELEDPRRVSEIEDRADAFRDSGHNLQAEASYREALAINLKAWPDAPRRWLKDITNTVNILREQRRF